MSYAEKENYLHHSWTLERRRGHIYNTLLDENMGLLEGRTLMLGCNTGSTLQLIDELGGGTVHGIEINNEAGRVAYKKGLLVTFGNALDMHATWTSTFDTIIAFDFIEHIYPSDMPKLIMECHRVLKPHGKLFAFSPRTDPERPSMTAMDRCHVQFFTDLTDFSLPWQPMFSLVKRWHETRCNPNKQAAQHDAYAMILESRKCE